MQEGSTQLIIFLVVSLALILLMGAFIILILFLYKKNQLKNIELIEQMRMKFENDILKAQLEIQEQTFHAISREIHDNINLSLTLAKLNLNTMGKTNNPINLKEPIDIISKVITELTDLSRSMNSNIITECGLISALSMELDRIKKLNTLNVHYRVTGIPVFLDSQRELFIFRIIQEALNNALKHSKAKNIFVSMHFTNEHLKIDLMDDGCGFDLATNNRKNNHPTAGLKNMKNRVEMLKGTYNMTSRPGEGTHFVLLIPFKNEYV